MDVRAEEQFWRFLSPLVVVEGIPFLFNDFFFFIKRPFSKNPFYGPFWRFVLMRVGIKYLGGEFFVSTGLGFDGHVNVWEARGICRIETEIARLHFWQILSGGGVSVSDCCSFQAILYQRFWKNIVRVVENGI